MPSGGCLQLLTLSPHPQVTRCHLSFPKWGIELCLELEKETGELKYPPAALELLTAKFQGLWGRTQHPQTREVLVPPVLLPHTLREPPLWSPARESSLSHG